jgi:ferrous iron transport protein B
MKQDTSEAAAPLPSSSFRGERRLNMALVGQPNSGKSTFFKAVASTSIKTGTLSGTLESYRECIVRIGLEEASLVDLPSIRSLHNRQTEEHVTLNYLLWGDEPAPVISHEEQPPAAPFPKPDLIIQVIEAAALERDLELTLELSQLGRPMVIALNMMDEAHKKGLYINHHALSEQLGIPVVPTTALMGHGISELFTTAATTARENICPLPQPYSPHISDRLPGLSQLLMQDDIHNAFEVPHPFLLFQLAFGDPYFMDEIRQHFPELQPEIWRLRSEAEQTLPRRLHEEMHADHHHRVASLYETVLRAGAPYEIHDWRYWLDEFFLHPQWGLLGSLAVFAAVLFIVFEVSVWLDSLTAARLIDLASAWQPTTTGGVIGRAVVDGLIGLIGIVVPYMIPLVLLLVALEEAGIMQRIAFVVDRGFHHIGLHGGVALPMLMGLGCNVPAICAVGAASQGRERVIASLLITFIPCSARSAIILALAGKYLGGLGVFSIFMLSLIVIAVMGRLLARRYPKTGPGEVQEIPSFAWPKIDSLLRKTWERTRDILTIVTPLLVAGSVVLALLVHVHADVVINTLLSPITSWWLGLPIVLGVPILFGILRKELSLLMIYQALGTMDISLYMDRVQITTFLMFLTFYIPCVSTFAVMLKTIGRKEAFFSIALSVTTALAIAGVIRFALEIITYRTG